ncbi:MAG: DUF1846 domain-containing protein [Oscillospiraceae bacterium]|jgi:uncharacterized protein (UPF0371 family)|nr:DUF1846 domain-containing protein [Oscillospiraceae bacterium]
MTRIGFDNQKYIETQSARIRERIGQFGGKLYLEFGGKLFDDYHASRVLPGFEPDSKVRMLQQLRDDVEIVVAISAGDIEKNKVRGDLGIPYEEDVLRLIDEFRSMELFVGSVVVTQYSGQSAADAFLKRLEALGVPAFRHYPIPGYPHNVELIVSDEGYGRNDYIETSRPLVVVTAPGPGSGKMATCLSQLYHEHRRGKKAGYAKFETFPVWNLPLKHPVNLAYEAATADLNDVNMIDPFHLEAYGVTTVNYNRDVEVFPVLRTIFESILGECPYKSPTDMGVNMVGSCIVDDEACREASHMEILRRYYAALTGCLRGTVDREVVYKLELLMKRAEVTAAIFPAVAAALEKEEETGAPAGALVLPDGRVITGKTSDLLGASASLLLNALKALGGIDQELDLISTQVLEPICRLKTGSLGNKNPRLHSDEVLIALCVSALTNPIAGMAQQQLPRLKGCGAHFTVVLSDVDEKLYRRLGMHVSYEAKYERQRLYYK